MKAMRAVLADRRRRQRGSVLSGVLIMVAFLAIISGALVTSLSTQFLVSRVLVNRVGNEATVNSAMELALDQIQNTALASGCPGMSTAPQFAPVTLNGRTASVSYVSCWPTVDVKSLQVNSIAASAAFTVDGTHSFIPNTGQDLYVVGDSSGKIYSYQFGKLPSSSPPYTYNWSKDLGSRITGPPMAMQDAACGDPCTPDTGDPGTGKNADITFLVPIAGGSGSGSGCTANPCVELMGQDVPNTPDAFCFMNTGAAVTSRPAAGIAFPQIAYFGDSGGTLYANDATEFSCARHATPQATPGNAAIVAGPIVFKNGSQDEVFVVTSKGPTSQLLRYTYQGSFLTLAGTLTLPFLNAVGVAVEKTTSVPAMLAITFAGGGVAIARINSSYDPSLLASRGLGMGIAGAPFWCSCPAGAQIGAAGDNGMFYVLDTTLSTIASYSAGSPIRTTPASDGVGEWFVGTDDGYLYELQQPSGSPPVTMVQVAKYGGVGSVGSSMQVAGCPAGICIYLGSSSNAYIVPLDARDATITACLSNVPPACSGGNPRLWAQVEVGAAGTPQTVHVTGWSYYSP